MKVNLLDIIEIVTAFQLIIFSVFLFTFRGKRLSNIILGVHLLTQCLGILSGFIAFNQFEYFSENYPHLFLIGYPFSFLWGPSFYFYVKSYAFSDFKFKLKETLHLVPFILIVLLLVFTFYFEDAETKRRIIHSNLVVEHNIFFSMVRFIQVLVYNFASLVILKIYSEKIKQNYSSVSKINLSWLRLVIICFIIAYSISLSSYLLSVSLFQYRYFFNMMVYVTYFIFFNIIFFKGWQQQEIFIGVEEKSKYKSSALTKSEAEDWIEKINNYVCSNKPYLIPGITIEQMAEKIDITPRILSQIINEYFGQNFYDYINKLRIEEAKNILINPDCKKTILEVLYEVGYNSKSSFNYAFKKETGLTPTEYKKKKPPPQ